MAYRYNTLPFTGVILFAAILFFFRIPVSKLLDWAIVDPFFTTFETGIWKDIGLFVLLIILTRWIASEIRWEFLLKFFLYGLIFYAFQRTNNYWTFIHTSLVKQLTYWDIVFIAGVLCLPFSWFSHHQNRNAVIEDQQNGFIEDNAVTLQKDDHFKRKVVAAEIARLILLTKNQKSMAIGILGEYGSGKTSFLNLINLELKDVQVLKISFDPWSAGNPETIRRDFFDLLAREVAALDRRISSVIYSYARKFASFDSHSLSWLNWLGFLSNRGAIQSSAEYEQINKMLTATQHKVVITIDDLDRLHPLEIIEVLKLIRNTANFSNLVYLVAYDKAYVQDALRTLSKMGGLSYLDKIFQLEIPLPRHDEDDLLNMLQTRLKEILSNDHYEVFDKVMIPNDFRNRYEKAHQSILRQGRDVVRFINGFKIIYRLIGEEVDFESLILLELIKFRFPAIYELIYTQSDLFLSEHPLLVTHEQYYSPRMVKTENTRTKSDEISVFKTYIEKLEGLSAKDVSLLNGLFMQLFRDSSSYRPKAKNSISYPLYFDIYFRYRLSQKDLSDKDFRAAMTYGHMYEYMAYCASQNLHKELMTRLMQEDLFKSRTHFEEVLRWIFSFGRTFVKKEGIFRFNYDALIDKIYNYHNGITDQLYRKDQAAFARFMKQLFNVATPPFLFENELIYHLKKKGEGFVIPVAELTGYQLSYFTDMAGSGHGLSENTLWLFWGARKYYKVSAGNKGSYYERWSFEPALVEKMKVYLADKDPKYFLKFSIQRDMQERSQAFISSQVLKMFDNPAEYRKLVADNPVLDATIKKEYLEFFNKLAENDFKQYVEMDFKTELKKPERD